MITVGLTGGIGSGKTTVAKRFKDLGVPVYIADEASKEILATDLNVRNEIKMLLGEDAFVKNDDTEIPDKAYIALRVFQDKALLKGLIAILHPAVRKDFHTWLSKQHSTYVIYEAAILLESGGYDLCDYIIMVTAPLETRMQRVMSRDKVAMQDVRARMDNQWSERKKLDYAHFVIVNEDIHKLPMQINRIHEILLK
ncbi:MAG: dephospho-CoA kinase [Nonlabens sp.]|nr:dephospho-CoA kinase [Nonlabens sp.]